MEKYLVIDGNSILNRAFYGLAGARMTTADGLHTNAVFGFLNIYYMIMDKLNPDYVTVAFDLKAPTFRHKMFEDYKGTRKGMPDELKEQMPVIKEVLAAMNINIVTMEGYEADDILGTIAHLNELKSKETGEEIHTYILTGDRDSYQLISDNTTILYPSTKMGKTDYTEYTPELLMQEKGIEPYQVVDIKSLMGDASDNIPGVKGIGEKTAYTLIAKYTTMENIYANIDNLDASAKVIEKLKADENMARMSYTLATINKEVPLEIDYEKNRVQDVNKEALFPLFKKLAFNKFLQKYDFDGVKEEIVEQSAKESSVELKEENVILIDQSNFASLRTDVLNAFKEEKISYILNIAGDDASFTSILNLKDKNFVSVYSKKSDKCYIINIDSIDKRNDVTKILESFASSNSIKLGYNIKQDMRYIMTYTDAQIVNFNYDLLIACYLLDSTRNFKFDTVLDELFGIMIDISSDSKQEVQLSLFDTQDIKPSIDNKLAYQIGLATKCIYESKDLMDQRLEKDNMKSLMYDIEIPLSETLASMETVGMYVDKDKLEAFGKDITQRIEELEKQIYELAGEEFNINSTQQLGNILFEKLGLPAKKKTKTKSGYSTSKEVLEELEDAHEIIPLLIEYRQTMKLKSTYVDGLKETIKEDGRIHTTFTQTVTSTGRLSSVEPNLQNIPIRLELGSKIRTFFTAPVGRVIADADYSQIELRVLSHISKDKTMQHAFIEGIDVHKVTASQVFGVPLEEVTKQMRSKAKAVNFGIVYGISEFGLAKNIGTSWGEAKDYMNTYLEKYHGIREFMANIVEIAKEQGYVTTMFGRRRYVPELKNKNKNIVLFGQRIAMNTPIQGTAADIIKIAMNKLYKALKDNNLKSKLVMQVHDELIVETYNDEIDRVKEIMKDAMENVVKLDVPLDVDLNIGQSWYDAK